MISAVVKKAIKMLYLQLNKIVTIILKLTSHLNLLSLK